MLRFRAVFPTSRVRNDRGRADAEHLGKPEDDEREIAGDRDAGNRFRPEPANPVEIDEEVKRLKDHHHEHEARGLEQVARDRAGGEILHHPICPTAPAETTTSSLPASSIAIDSSSIPPMRYRS